MTGVDLGGARYPEGPPEQWPSEWPGAAPAPGGAPTGPDAGSAPAGPGGPGPRVVVGAILAAVLVVAAVAGAWAALGGDGDDTATEAPPSSAPPAETSPPLEPAPTMPSIPGLDPDAFGDPAAQARPLDEVLPEIIALVEEVRGLEFRTPPSVEALEPAAFEDRLRDQMEQDAAEDPGGDESATLRALGLIDADDDLEALATEAAEASVLGFYLPGDGDLFVKGDVITPLVQAIIAHELTHALDDQHFDLTRLEELSGRPDEAALGFLSVVEGSAERVRTAYVDRLDPDERAALEAEQIQLGLEQASRLFDLPPIVAVSSQVPYSAGLRLVEALVEGGGTGALDAAFLDPPTTSEQVLDPEVYAARQPPVPVPVPAADGEAVDEGVLGAADLQILVVAGSPLGLLDPAVARPLEPLDGFGGGSYVTWLDGDEACIRMVVVGDDVAGADRVRGVLDEWSEASAPDAELAAATGPQGQPGTEVTACA